MGVSTILHGLAKLSFSPVFSRAFSKKKSTQEVIERCALGALNHLERGKVSISVKLGVIDARVDDLDNQCKITQTKVDKTVYGASFVKLSVEPLNQVRSSAAFAGLCKAIGSSKEADFLTINVEGLDTNRKNDLKEFLDCKVLNANELLIPGTTRKIIEGIWGPSQK